MPQPAAKPAREDRMAPAVKVPTPGESPRRPGDRVKRDEPIASLETDKVAIEVPSPVAGTMGDQLVKAGDTVAVGAGIAHVEAGGARPGTGPGRAGGSPGGGGGARARHRARTPGRGRARISRKKTPRTTRTKARI